MSGRLAKIVSLGGVACVFTGGMITLPFHQLSDLAISLPLSLITGAGIWHFWPGHLPAKPDVEQLFSDQEALKRAGVSKAESIETIRLVSNKLDHILMCAAQINDPKITRRIQALDTIGRKIIADFRQNPTGIKQAQTWIHAYLDQTIDCVDQYAQLHMTKVRNDEIRRQMVEFEDMLVELQEKSQELLDRLLSADTTTFEVNVSVFRDMMKNEGI